MNFIQESQDSVDSGDALDCITVGIETVTTALRTLRGKPTPEQIDFVLESLEEWKTAAQALIDVTEPDADDYPCDDNCTGSGP